MNDQHRGLPGVLTILLALPSLASASVIVTFGGTAVTNEGVVSSQAGASTINFDNNAAPSNYSFLDSSQAGIVSGNYPNYYAAPTGDSSPYLAVGITSAVVNLSAAPATYFGLDWGSIDSYNTISLTQTNGAVDRFTGSQIAALDGVSANGATSAFINFYAPSGTAWQTITLSSSNYAFESDNHAFATATPEPATWSLLAAGLGLTGAAVWGRKRLASKRGGAGLPESV